MQRIIHKEVENGQLKSKADCIDMLIQLGFSFTSTDTMEFIERYNFTTHSGKNRIKVFKPLLKGKIILNTEKNSVKWILNVNDIIFKSISTCILTLIIFQIYHSKELINSLTVGIIIGGLVFGINWILLNNRIEKITGEILNK